MTDRTAKAVLWMLVDVGGSQGLSFAIYIVLSRILTPSEYGVFALALGITAIANVVLFQGFGDALIERKVVNEDDLSTAFWTNLGLGIGIAAALYLSAPWLSALFHAPRLGPVIATMAALCVLRALVSVHSALCRRELKMSLFAARALTGYILGGAAGITLALLGWGVWSLVICQIVQAVAILMVMWMTIAWRPRLRFSLTSFRELAAFSGSFIAASVLTSITDKIDNLIIGLFLDVTAVGYYTLAFKLLQAVGLIAMSPLQAIMMPVLARLARDRRKFADEYIRLVTASTVTWLPIVAAVGVIAPTLLPLAFGDRWDGAVPVLRAMCFACFSVTLWSFTGQALSALGRPQLYAGLAALQLAVAGLAFAVASRFGIVAVGAAWATVSALIVPIHFLVLRRGLGIPLTALMANAIRISISGISMVVIMAIARHFLGVGVIATCTEVIIGVVVYVALLELAAMPGYASNLMRVVRVSLPLPGPAR